MTTVKQRRKLFGANSCYLFCAYLLGWAMFEVQAGTIISNDNPLRRRDTDLCGCEGPTRSDTGCCGGSKFTQCWFNNQQSRTRAVLCHTSSMRKVDLYVENSGAWCFGSCYCLKTEIVCSIGGTTLGQEIAHGIFENTIPTSKGGVNMPRFQGVE